MACDFPPSLPLLPLPATLSPFLHHIIAPFSGANPEAHITQSTCTAVWLTWNMNITHAPTATRVPRYGEACAFLPPSHYPPPQLLGVRHNTYSNSLLVVSSCGCVQVWWACSLVLRLHSRRETFHSSHAAWVRGQWVWSSVVGVFKCGGCVQGWWVCSRVVGVFKCGGCVQGWWVCSRVVGVFKYGGLALLLFMFCENISVHVAPPTSPSQTNVSPQTQSPHNSLQSLQSPRPRPGYTTVSPSASQEESHRGAHYAVRGRSDSKAEAVHHNGTYMCVGWSR